MRHRAPTIAQNALPVIDDPWITFVPWPIQTAPVRTSTAPTTRLAMTMNIPTRGVENWFPSCWASFERFHYRLRRCSGMSPELREVQDFDLGDRAVRREEDGGRVAGAATGTASCAARDVKASPYVLRRGSVVDPRASMEATPASHKSLDVGGLPLLVEIVNEEMTSEVGDPAVPQCSRAECFLHGATGLAWLYASDGAVQDDQTALAR